MPPCEVVREAVEERSGVVLEVLAREVEYPLEVLQGVQLLHQTEPLELHHLVPAPEQVPEPSAARENEPIEV